jgi:hypothetical protein
MLSRREFLRSAMASAILLPFGRHYVARWQSRSPKPDAGLLDEICKAGFRYFWEAASPYTGIVKDRCHSDGPDARTIGSIAATGFGLTVLCLGAEFQYETRPRIEERVLRTLEFFHGPALREKGFFYHFVDLHSGERLWNSEVSSIDTALLLCGVLACREYFANDRIRSLADGIYRRADFRWMLNDGMTLSHGWKPETGFLKPRWDTYSEHMMLYLLAIGSPTYSISEESWAAWARPIYRYFGEEYVGCQAPLFIHQYSHAWIDFRGKRDHFADYFVNSIRATRAHIRFCLDLAKRFPKYSDQLWGITASDSAHGYVAWGGPPAMGPIDGTVVPSAAAGSLPFLPDQCLKVLYSIRNNYKSRCWKRYGFVDAFNPNNSWTNPDVIGINAGIATLMAANLNSQLPWKIFMKAPEISQAMTKVGLTA